jgi:HK97 family phage major capsid protein
MTPKLADLRKQRAAAFDGFKALAEQPTLSDAEQVDYADKEQAVRAFDEQITRAKVAQDLAGASAEPVAGQLPTVATAPETDKYTKERSLVLGGAIKMLGLGGGSIYQARASALEVYGESHPVTRALITSAGTSGGFLVPPDVMPGVIELLRARAVVRSAGPRIIPMPRGTMTLPGQNSTASASYGAEGAKIANSQPGFNSIVASYKKMVALVPVSNDMMRYADPAVDAVVRDDLVKVIALREYLAFLQDDGTLDTPKSMLAFANDYAKALAGTVGNFLLTVSSTTAAGGNFITSTAAYTLATVASELGGAVMHASGAATDSTDRVAADIAVVVVALLPTRPDLTVPEIEKHLRINRFDGTDKRPGIMEAVTRLMIASGLVSQGELEALADQALAAPTVTTEG